MPDPRLTEIRNHLAAKLDQAASHLMQNGGAPVPADLDALEGLKRLSDLYVANRPSSGLKPWIWGLICAAASVLLVLYRFHSTDIDLQANVTALSFVVGSSQQSSDLPSRTTVLVDGWQVRSIGIVGFDSADLSGIGQGHEARQPARALYAEALSGKASPGEITVNGIEVVGSEVRMESKPGDSVALTCHPGKFSLSFNGSVSVDFDGSGPKLFDFDAPAEISFHSGDGPVGLEFVLYKDKHLPRVIGIPVIGLDLAAVERSGQAEYLDRRLSTIRSGSLFFESLAGKELKLRSAEDLRLGRLAGYLQLLALRDGELQIRFTGTANSYIADSRRFAHLLKGVSIGEGSYERNLMPSALEYLYAWQPLVLLVPVLGGVFAFINAVRK